MKVGEFLTWVQGFLQEPNGSASSSRLLMFIFGFWSMGSLTFIIRHVIGMTDVGQLNVWLANLPLLIAAFMGLIALPYTINQGKAGLTDIADMFVKYRAKGNDDSSPAPVKSETKSKAKPTVSEDNSEEDGTKGEKG